MSDAEATLRALLATVATEHGYQNDVTVTPVTSDGANYTSAIFHANIASPNKQDLKLFAKVALISESFRKDLPLGRLYTVERYFYNKLNFMYQKIQDEHDLLGEHRLMVPKCYAFNEEYLFETVVLEDLSAKGFTTNDRLKSIDWEYAARAVDEMAKLHALSFAYAQKYPKEFEQATKYLYLDILAPHNIDNFKVHWNKMVLNTLKVVNAEYKDRLVEYINVHFKPELMDTFCKPLKYPVLVHGDYKQSNLMHKIGRDGKLEVIILDYQTLQSGCTVRDLLYFVFTSSDADFRSRYFHLLVDHYYKRLCESMQRLQLDSEAVYPRTEFDLEMQAMLPFGLQIGISVLQVVTVDASNAPKFDQEHATFATEPSALFAERLNEIVRDFATWGII